MAYFLYNDKKINYTDNGQGEPLIIIHGNSVSSRMHQKVGKECQKYCRVISIDLPGHGKSERIAEWATDFWYEHSKSVHALIQHLNLENVILLGYSGGAQISLNIVLEHPQYIRGVIADSFEGEKSDSSYAEGIFADREKAKKNIIARIFWYSMHGKDWEDVVDSDSKVIYEHHKKYGSFFHKDLSEIDVPVLLTASKKDEYIEDIDAVFQPMQSKIKYCRTIIYDEGKHPASLTVGKKYIKDLIEFISGLEMNQVLK